MTVRDPTPSLELRLAREKAGDFEWAFNRLVDLIAAEILELSPERRQETLDLVQRAFERLHEENVERQAVRTRAANLAEGFR